MKTPDAPVTYGASTHGLRGDYAGMRPDYTLDQDYSQYGEADQDRWRRLYARQMRLVPGRACPEFLRVVDTLGSPSVVGNPIRPNSTSMISPGSLTRTVTP